jgi:sec-independent protein translocase protein TatC
MPIGPARMPFLDHLAELRRRSLWVLLLFGVCTVALYFFVQPVFNFLIAPVRGSLSIKPIATEVLGAMNVRFSLAMWTSLVGLSPVIMWQTLAFLLPALKPKERKWVVPTFFTMVVLFAGGVVFAYKFMLTASFGWLAQQGAGFITFMPTANDVLTVVQFILFIFGVAFQTPVLVFYLVYFRVIPYGTLRKNWRTVYLVIALAAAFIPPDWNWVTIASFALVLVVLYEASMALVWIALGKRIKRQALEAEGY